MTVLGARTTAVMTAEHGESRAAAPLHHAGRMLAVSDAVAALLVVLVAGLVPDAISRLAPAFLFVPMWVVAVCATGDYQLPGHLGARVRRLLVAALVLPTGALLAADVVGYPLSARTRSEEHTSELQSH